MSCAKEGRFSSSLRGWGEGNNRLSLSPAAPALLQSLVRPNPSPGVGVARQPRIQFPQALRCRHKTPTLEGGELISFQLHDNKEMTEGGNQVNVWDFSPGTP